MGSKVVSHASPSDSCTALVFQTGGENVFVLSARRGPTWTIEGNLKTRLKKKKTYSRDRCLAV